MRFYAKKGLLIKVQYFYRSEDIALICYSFMLERGTDRERKERDCIKKIKGIKDILLRGNICPTVLNHSISLLNH